MRLLILLAVIYLCFRMIKSWIRQNSTSQRPLSSTQVAELDDVMEKDPFCEVYFPKKDGVHLKFDGKDLYFCGNECRDKFIVEQSKFEKE